MSTVHDPPSTEFLTVAEMARLYRVSLKTITRNATLLGGQRVGRVWRFPTPIRATTLEIPDGRTPGRHR